MRKVDGPRALGISGQRTTTEYDTAGNIQSRDRLPYPSYPTTYAARLPSTTHCMPICRTENWRRGRDPRERLAEPEERPGRRQKRALQARRRTEAQVIFATVTVQQVPSMSTSVHCGQRRFMFHLHRCLPNTSCAQLACRQERQQGSLGRPLYELL